jgi:hypothetical protein
MSGQQPNQFPYTRNQAPPNQLGNRNTGSGYGQQPENIDIGTGRGGPQEDGQETLSSVLQSYQDRTNPLLQPPNIGPNSDITPQTLGPPSDQKQYESIMVNTPALENRKTVEGQSNSQRQSTKRFIRRHPEWVRTSSASNLCILNSKHILYFYYIPNISSSFKLLEEDNSNS